MFQQISSASICMRTRFVIDDYAGCQNSTPFVLNGPTQSLIALIPPSALFSCPRKQLPLTFWLADVYLNVVDLFGECVCIHYFNRTLVSTFTNESRFCHLLVVRCD
jgi:hypothetical protein